MSYAAPYTELRWSLPTELRWTLLSYAVPYWGTLFSTELRSTTWATLQRSWATFSNRTLCNFVKCRNSRLSGTGIRVPQSDAPVPGWDAGCRNTDAQLWYLDTLLSYWLGSSLVPLSCPIPSFAAVASSTKPKCAKNKQTGYEIQEVRERRIS
jgi:hypothetical protein